MKTKVVNFFGGPGCGKSTTASLLFGNLKQNNYDAELVTEYAKELVWEDRTKTLANQMYVIGKQINRIETLLGKVDVVITDSPILLGQIYRGDHYPKEFDDVVKWQFDQHDNVNFFLKRVKPFNQNGRVHSLEESIENDNRILDILNESNYSYYEINGDEAGVEEVIKIVKHILK